jgi:hypothetical protein
MHYLIARDGQQLGQFSEEELRSGLFEGRYLSTDVAWTEGMADWKPLGELMGQGTTRVATPRPGGSSGTGTAGDASWHAPTHTAGLAIAALVLGIISVLTCGGLGLGAIAAIACGHMALTKIGKAGGILGGRGIAVTGLIMGYVSILLIGVGAILASLSTASIGKMAERGQAVKGINVARQLSVAVKLHAAGKQGMYPATLEELVATGALTQEGLDEARSFKVATWQGVPGFEYRGAGMSDSDPGDKVLFISNAQDAKGKRIVGRNDGSVELMVPPSP